MNIPIKRKLASIRSVGDIQPIADADLIEVCTVDGWKLVSKKGEFHVGDLAVYFEIDSFLPIAPEYEFLRKSSFKVMAGNEGFRLRTIKLRGQVSQGLLLPLTILKDKIDATAFSNLAIGDDVTEILGVTKYESPIPAQLAGLMKGGFPIFVPKTDEERIQNLAVIYENLKKSTFYVTEKFDGSSATFYYNNGEFGVCSRNIDLLETSDNTFWQVARKYNLEEALAGLGTNIVLQGELIGEGIQDNIYKKKGHDVYFFNAFDIDRQCYYDFDKFNALITGFNLMTVPVLYHNFKLPDSIDDLLLFADGNSVLNKNVGREGLVIRSYDRNISFKAISNKFLLKQEG